MCFLIEWHDKKASAWCGHSLTWSPHGQFHLPVIFTRKYGTQKCHLWSCEELWYLASPTIWYKRWGPFQMMEASEATFASNTHPSYHLIPRASRPEQNPEQSGVSCKQFFTWRPALKRPNVAWRVHQGLLVSGRDIKSEGWKKPHVMEKSWTSEIWRLGREMLPLPEQVCLWDWCHDRQAALKLRCGAGEQMPVLTLKGFLSSAQGWSFKNKTTTAEEKTKQQVLPWRHVTLNISTSKAKENIEWDFKQKKRKKNLHTRGKKWIRPAPVGYKRQDMH